MKKFYRENRVLVILAIVVIICMIISTILLFKYFYFGNGSDKYGDRLEKIQDIQITKEHKNEVISKIEENKLVKSAKVDVKGAIIYVTINFNEEVSLVEAQSVAVTTLDSFSDEEKNGYDISFNILEDKTETSEGFNMWGSKNAGREKISWNNNHPVTSNEESEQ